MKRKTAMGILLMLLSFGLLVFWETHGRNALLLSPVLAASRDIVAGETVLPQDVTTIYVLPQNVVQGALLPEAAEQLLGNTSVYPLGRNQQLTASLFKDEQDVFRGDQSIFPISEHWIGSMSCMIRPGDVVRLISASSEIDLGSHRVACVVDHSGKAIYETSVEHGDVLDRYTDADPAASLEIICTLEEYKTIYQNQSEVGPRDLIIYMEGGL